MRIIVVFDNGDKAEEEILNVWWDNNGVRYLNEENTMVFYPYRIIRKIEIHNGSYPIVPPLTYISTGEVLTSTSQ